MAQDGLSSWSDVSDFTGEDGIKCLGKSSVPTVSLKIAKGWSLIVKHCIPLCCDRSLRVPLSDIKVSTLKGKLDTDVFWSFGDAREVASSSEENVSLKLPASMSLVFFLTSTQIYNDCLSNIELESKKARR